MCSIIDNISRCQLINVQTIHYVSHTQARVRAAHWVHKSQPRLLDLAAVLDAK